jgi:LPXTG-motif cell wall-anchored protein
MRSLKSEEDRIVKRTATIAILSVGLTIASAATALAANYPPTPNNSSGHSGASGGNGSLASTGGNVTLGMILLVALVVVGVAALVIGRRRARA